MKGIFEELHYLTSIPALSGLEEKMIREMVSRFKPLANKVEVDQIGNVTATFNGKSENEPSMLVFAHIDELGLMVRKIEKNGFLRFDRIGGMPEKTLMASSWMCIRQMEIRLTREWWEPIHIITHLQRQKGLFQVIKICILILVFPVMRR